VRYRREVSEITAKVKALIFAIAGYVAKAIAFQQAVIIALVGIVGSGANWP